jgi:hypothetical protein
LEKTLGSDDLPSPLASGTGLGLSPRAYAGPIAGLTIVKPMKNEFFFFPIVCFFQGYFQIIPKAFSLAGPGPSAPSATEPKTKKIFKYIPEAGEDIFESAETPKTSPLESFMAETIVNLSFLSVS